MNESTRLNAKVGIPGKTKTKLQRHLTLEMISGWIKLQGFDEYTTNGLIELAAGYPTQALPTFRNNFNIMIERVRQKRRKELQGEEAPPVSLDVPANITIPSLNIPPNITIEFDQKNLPKMEINFPPIIMGDKIVLDDIDIPEVIICDNTMPGSPSCHAQFTETSFKKDLENG